MSVNNDNFLIETNDIELAQGIASGIADDNIRNRAMANVLAAKLACKYFTDMDIDVHSGIHNVVNVLKDIDVSDVYVNGNYIDVRIYIDENEIFVPKFHFDADMLPVAYMFIKTDSNLTAGYMAGFAFPEDIDTTTDINGYYQLKEDELKSFYDTELRIVTVIDEGIDNDFKKETYDFLDGKISGKNLYKTLISSLSAREFLAEIADADRVLCSLDLEKLNNTADDEPSSMHDDNTEEMNPMLMESSEELELEPSSDIELIEPINSEYPDLIDVEEDELQMDSDELSIGLENENLDITAEPQDESWQEESYQESDNLSDRPEEYINMQKPEELEIAEEELEEELEEESEYEKDDEEDQYVPNSNFGSKFESSGEIAKSEPAPTSIRPRFVIVDDDMPQTTDYKSEEDADEFQELSKFDYSTEIMPSISSIEADNQDDRESDHLTEEMLTSSDRKPYSEPQSMEDSQDTSANGEQIESLFGQNPHKSVNTSRKKGSPLPFIGFIVILGALGYYGYTKFYSPVPDVINNNPTTADYKTEKTVNEEKAKPQEVAMPVETVENVPVTKAKDEASSVSIPAIEQNLNASIDVSNLSVNWEVPQAYANNTTAKRYFVKIGKILQLNLKTELLFLSSSPITNKISVELEFNKDSNKFVITKFINSSGRTNIDDVIKDTVEKALNMNSSTNMSVFKNLQGNPVLVIKL